MSPWNPYSPDSWARRLGMVQVPLFDAAHSASHRGEHFILLDGEKATCEWSLGEWDDLKQTDGPLSWSWSSNVLNSVVVDKAQSLLFSRRWDDPENVRQMPLPDEDGARALIDSFDDADSARSSTVIDRALEAFRTVRTAIQQLGGPDSWTMLVFIVLLEWIRQGAKNQVAAELERAAFAQLVRGPRPTELLLSITHVLSSERLQEIGTFLLRGDSSDSFLLDADLLIRHASGTLLQEAHLQIAKSLQRSLFLSGSVAPSVTRGEPKHDAYFTPPSLARLLVQESLAEVERLKGASVSAVDILDPACGSGVFLIEAVRELQAEWSASAIVRGWDTSSDACLTTDYNLAHIASGSAFKFQVQEQNSLLQTDWGGPDVIVTNPPFSSWEMMSEEEQAMVRKALGDLYFGRSDKALAFIVAAIRNLKNGGVLATLAPQSFLTSQSASRVRQWISDDPTLHVRLIGLFSGFSYFRGAIVEPAFFIISRGGTEKLKTLFVLAPDRAADHAIRHVRLLRSGITTNAPPDVHVYDAPLSADRWKPDRPAVSEIKKRMARSSIPTVADLFHIWEGIRTGANPVFIVPAWRLEEFGHDDWKAAFRPDASNDTIRAGRLSRARFLFYPYRTDGTSLYRSETELSRALPGYYADVLKPNRDKLRGRAGISGQWWELTRPRQKWGQHSKVPRIISTVFADTGSVTFDQSGEYVITQGFFWQWRRDKIDENLAFAYTALLNSTVFVELCRTASRSVRGGQVDFYPHHVKDVFLPDLSSDALTDVGTILQEIGREITTGRRYRLETLNALTSRAYGIPLDDLMDALGRSARAKHDRFILLARRWKRDTSARASTFQMARHPAYQEIIQMGRDALPFIIADLKRQNPALWFEALEEITGADAVRPEHRGLIDKMIEDWLLWAESEGVKT